MKDLTSTANAQIKKNINHDKPARHMSYGTSPAKQTICQNSSIEDESPAHTTLQ